MRINVTLNESIRNDASAKTLALKKIVESSGIENVNMKRFNAFGVVSGDVDEDKLLVINDLDEVKSVEPDGRVYASPLAQE